jgi:hypothetical protein
MTNWLIPPEASVDRFTVPFYLDDVSEIAYFVGRQAALSSIGQVLPPFTTAQREVMVLHRFGGIGKTQLTIHYASQFQKHYKAAMWFSVKDEHSLRQSFVKTAERLPGASHLSRTTRQPARLVKPQEADTRGQGLARIATE